MLEKQNNARLTHSKRKNGILLLLQTGPGTEPETEPEVKPEAEPKPKPEPKKTINSTYAMISALKKLRNSHDIEDDILEMRAEEQAQLAEAKITLFELITSPTLKLPLLIAIIMQLSQQLSGINAVSPC